MDSKDKIVDLSGLCVELYSASTPNGIKVAACLEELRSLSNGKFQYEQVIINIRNNAQVAEDYLQINPNGKVPTIVNAEEGCIVYESGAILLYLAEKSGALLPSDRAQRTIATSWLFWSSTGLSNQVKQFGYYYKSCQHSIPYCVSRYAKEVKRLLLVLEKHLSDNRAYIIGEEYTIADISIWPWIYALYNHCGPAAEEVFESLRDTPTVVQWYERCFARPASQKALTVCSPVKTA
eukprot:gene15865-18125_t